MENKLYKSDQDCVIFGVCGGLAEYLQVDSTWVRLALAISILFFGTGLGIYILAALIIPRRSQ